jgi:hypothetical protein
METYEVLETIRIHTHPLARRSERTTDQLQVKYRITFAVDYFQYRDLHGNQMWPPAQAFRFCTWHITDHQSKSVKQGFLPKVVMPWFFSLTPFTCPHRSLSSVWFTRTIGENFLWCWAAFPLGSGGGEPQSFFELWFRFCC